MPGIPTHFRVLDMAMAHLPIDKSRVGYASLGAVGPSWGDFLPAQDTGQGLPTPTKYWEVWNRVLSVVFGYDPEAPGTDKGHSLYRTLRTFEDHLPAFENAVKARDEGKLKELNDAGVFDQLMDAWTQNKEILDDLNLKKASFLHEIGERVWESVNMKPDPNNNMPPQPEELFVRDQLHWRRTGSFLRRLLQAQESDDTSAPNQDTLTSDNKAYAYGYLTSYVGKICGSPFINSIVNGPYRNYWWRHRWISNYVDAWVHGFYEEHASLTGPNQDQPTPPYAQWQSNLCHAKLHDRLAAGIAQSGGPFGYLLDPATAPEKVMNILRGKDPLPETLPPAFGNHWCLAFQAAHGYALGWMTGERRDLILTHAFLQLWLVLWFQTGTGIHGLGCELPAPDPKAAPPNSSWPSWTPPPDGGPPALIEGAAPPLPRPETTSDLLESISGVALALVGGWIWAAGAMLLGGAGLVGAVPLIFNSETVVPWDDLEQKLYQYRWYWVAYCNYLHDILLKAGLAFPYARELEDTIVDENGAKLDVGASRIRSRLREMPDYPQRQPDAAPKMTAWMSEPNGNTELDGTTVYRQAVFANVFLGDPGNIMQPLDRRRILLVDTPINNAHLFKTELHNPIACETAPALDNILDLLKEAPEYLKNGTDFPNWNLDADRGMYFWTWQFSSEYDTQKIEFVD